MSAPRAGEPVRGTDPRDEIVAEALSLSGLAVVGDYAPAALWRSLARDALDLCGRGAFCAAGVGRAAQFHVAPEIRGDQLHWIDPNRPTGPQQAWLLQMEGLRRALNERLYLGLFGFETHLALYPPGARYRTHLDRFADASFAQRCVSVLLYLNENWLPHEGGALRLYPTGADRVSGLAARSEAEPSEDRKGAYRDIEPSGGTLVAFLSGELHHEVLPAARERWSIAGWFTTRPSTPLG